MALYKDVLKIGKKLDKISTNNTNENAIALELLKTLSTIPITYEILQKTRIGMTVNSFRKKTVSTEATNLAKSLIKNWKKLVPESSSRNPGNGSTTSDEPVEVNSPHSPSGSRSTKLDSPAGSSSSNESHNGVTSSSNNNCLRQTRPADVIKVFETQNPVRLKCRDLLAQAMSIIDSVNVGDFVELAAQVENCIFIEFRNIDTKYKNRIRSRIANLKNTKNPRLREDVILGRITPEQFARMSTEEMASDDMKQLREQMTKEAINDHQMGVAGSSKSDLFRCSRCGKRNTMYNQIQLLSSDEPMTTFVLCNECGHRWRFE